MKKNETDNRIEVKATVTEVLDSETDIIYDGGVHRDIERENWKERREMLEKLGSRGGSRHTFLDRDDVDDVFPRQDHYIETTTRVRACYVMDGQTYACYESFSYYLQHPKNGFAKLLQKKNAAIFKRLQRFSNRIQLCAGRLFVPCFDFLNLFCRCGNNLQSRITYTVKQRFKLSALRGLTCDLIREKELIYRNVKKGAKFIQHLQTWVLPLIFYGNKVTGS